jgi:mycofactocin precursor
MPDLIAPPELDELALAATPSDRDELDAAGADESTVDLDLLVEEISIDGMCGVY